MEPERLPVNLGRRRLQILARVQANLAVGALRVHTTIDTGPVDLSSRIG
jgi:hypothetical protein